MKSPKLPLLIVASLCVLFTIAVSTQHSLSASTKAPPASASWEHLALPVDAQKALGDAETSGTIVRLGNEGWELVDVETFAREGSTTRVVYFFKRPKS